MAAAIEHFLAAAVSSGECCIGEVVITALGGNFSLRHRDDEERDDFVEFQGPERALEIARYDDAGDFRPLKTAPNLRHGWRLKLADLRELQRALDYFYPGRLAILSAWQSNQLTTTTLRDTLNRQSGMYRIAAKITDPDIESVVGTVCRTDGGCLRQILWRRDRTGSIPSTQLPSDKYQPETIAHRLVPLLCQEACAVLINECRNATKRRAER